MPSLILSRIDTLLILHFHVIEYGASTEASVPAEGSDYTTAMLIRLGQDEQRTRQVMEVVQQAVSRHPRVMVFCPSVANAKICAERLQTHGVQTGLVTANSTEEERRDAIQAFRSGGQSPMALFNYGVLTAGFDAPRTRCVVVARPTTSLVLYSQMVGRALRGPKAGGNRRCDIFTVVDRSLPGFGSIAEAFTHWEDVWSQK